MKVLVHTEDVEFLDYNILLICCIYVVQRSLQKKKESKIKQRKQILIKASLSLSCILILQFVLLSMVLCSLRVPLLMKQWIKRSPYKDREPLQNINLIPLRHVFMKF